MKYVVLSRYQDGSIANSFGVFRNKNNAYKRMMEIRDDDFEYCIEEVDPCGSFADDECEDEF